MATHKHCDGVGGRADDRLVRTIIRLRMREGLGANAIARALIVDAATVRAVLAREGIV